MTRNRIKGFRRGQEIKNSNRAADKSLSAAFDEEKFWPSIEKNYFSPPSSKLITSIKNIIEMYKVIESTMDLKKTTNQKFSFDFLICRCSRFTKNGNGRNKTNRSISDELNQTKRINGEFDPVNSSRYHGKGALPPVIRKSPDSINLKMMNTPFFYSSDVLSQPINSIYNSDDIPNFDDDAWALHPRFSPIIKNTNFIYPPYAFEQNPGEPFCNKCYGIQLNCGSTPKMDFQIDLNKVSSFFRPTGLHINILRRLLTENVEMIDDVNSIQSHESDIINEQPSNTPSLLTSTFNNTIEEDFCITYEYYSELINKISSKLKKILLASESEYRIDYSLWKDLELKMLSQYKDEYKDAGPNIRYAYTSSLQIDDIENLRLTCPDSSQLPHSWTEKALCSVCSTADDWDDNPIMFCDCCYLPIHIKCLFPNFIVGKFHGSVPSADDCWVCFLCSYLVGQLPDMEIKTSFDVVRRLSTPEAKCAYSDLKKRSRDCDTDIGYFATRYSFTFKEIPRIPVNDSLCEKFVKRDSEFTVESNNLGLIYAKNPNMPIRMCSSAYEDISVSIPFCLFCGFTTNCTSGGPALPTTKGSYWAHIKCAHTLHLSLSLTNEQDKQKLPPKLVSGKCIECKKWGSCMAQCARGECGKFFHLPCVAASKDCIFEWDTLTNRPDILCKTHSIGVSPTMLLRKVQHKLEADTYKMKYSKPSNIDLSKLGIYARDFLDSSKIQILEMFSQMYYRFKNENVVEEKSSDGVLSICFNLGDISIKNNNSPSNFSDELPIKRKREEAEFDCQSSLKVDLEIHPKDQVDVRIPLQALPTPSMLIDIFTNLPSYQTIKYTKDVLGNKNVPFLRSICEGIISLSDVFDLSSDVDFIVNLFNYVSRMSFEGINQEICLEQAKIVNLKALRHFCSGCGLVESKRVLINKCKVCLASICKTCFKFGISASRSISNCTNSQFDGGNITCARCYRYISTHKFGSCYLCGRIDGFFFRGNDCLVHLICAQLLIPPKCWVDGLRLGKIKNTKGNLCHYCRLNIGITSTCASPTCGTRFHPYCVFVLKGSFLTEANIYTHKPNHTKGQNLLRPKKPGIAFARILCLSHIDKDNYPNHFDYSTSFSKTAVFNFFRGIDYTFSFIHSEETRSSDISQKFVYLTSSRKRKPKRSMDASKKRAVKKTDLRKFLTMQEIMQYGHSGRTTDDSYYCPICFSLYYETTPGLPGDDLHWIGCDGCERWFHWVCIGYTDNDPPKDTDWFCTTCTNPKQQQQQQQLGDASE